MTLETLIAQASYLTSHQIEQLASRERKVREDKGSLYGTRIAAREAIRDARGNAGVETMVAAQVAVRDAIVGVSGDYAKSAVREASQAIISAIALGMHAAVAIVTKELAPDFSEELIDRLSRPWRDVVGG